MSHFMMPPSQLATGHLQHSARPKVPALHAHTCQVFSIRAPGCASTRASSKFVAKSANHHRVLAVATLDREAVKVEANPSVLQDPGSFVEEFDEAYEEQDYDDASDVVQVDATQIDDSLRVENLGLCPETVSALRRRGIEALFPIQKHVFEPIMQGRDLIGRAKTGSGKTLAFALPVIEDLIKENKTKRPSVGRPPRCVVLAPTRELANQVAREFESACPTLKVKSVYGGVSIGVQMSALERGLDIVVGTPGRVIDLIERKKLVLGQVRYAILDEADQMLDMGFEEDMETILREMPEQRQTLLFSATLPKWVSKVAKRFQQNPVLVDLVGEENTGKLADTIRCLVYPVAGNKMTTVLEVLSVYAAGGKAIVFTNTKKTADEVAAVISATNSCEALHGDIGQAQREQTLQRFRDGRVNVMVATDVAARGLDIPSVDLVVHFDLPNDSEAFLHRSGRTGRAGNKGTTIVMQAPSEARVLGQLLTATKTTEAELIGAPNPADVMRAASRTVLTKLDQVDPGVIDFFQPAADKLLASGQPERVLAAALAAISGFKLVPRSHSLLTGLEGFTTLKLTSDNPGELDGINSLLRSLKPLLKFTRSTVGLDKSVIGKIQLFEDPKTSSYGLVFDIADDVAAELLAAYQQAGLDKLVLEAPRSLPINPKLLMHKERTPRPDRSFGGRRDGGRRGGWENDRYGGRGRRDDSYGGRQSRSPYGGGGGGGSYGNSRDRDSYGARGGGRGERGDWGRW